MNDYDFGNRLLALRTSAGLSQARLGSMLGVSDKAVSKWENGKAKPGTDVIRKLAAALRIPVEDLLALREAGNKPHITTIVVTGGPCAGKTTAMSWIQNAFSARGYTVLFVAETASELINGGIAPWSLHDNLSFQQCLVGLQLQKERVFRRGAESLKANRVLIVCDRGAMDNKAYMSELEFQLVAREMGRAEVELRDTYDAVFHLVTAAKGAEDAYTCENNRARTESMEQAAALDDKLLAAWTGHPHLRVIDNTMAFDDKMKRLVAEIASFLGEPEPMEVERKFLIEYPDLKWLAAQPNCRSVDIIQTYLKAPEGEELRVRQRGMDGAYIYYLTHKRRVSAVKRVEVERRLSKDEYLRLLMDADTTKRQIRKTRYCLTHQSQYFEIDVFPFWHDKAIVEIELRDESDPISFPPQLRIIKEVTDDPAYWNATLADIG